MEKNQIMDILGNAKVEFDRLNTLCERDSQLEQQIVEKQKLATGKMSIGQIIILILAYCMYIVPGIVYQMYVKNANKKKAKEQIEPEIAALQEQRRALAVEINSQCEAVMKTGINQILPDEYLDGIAIRYIYSYLAGGRADSLKEAMNLFEEEKHRMNMESMQSEYIRQAQLGNKLAAYGNLINAANAINNARR